LAQDGKRNEQTVQIKTSAVCKMCKAKIERELAFEKGVKNATLDVPSQILTVSFNPQKTDVDKIRKAINQTGYDADELPANPKAYDKLDDCCKKDQGIHEDQ
jgi:periplasmic mercuric ion binding protein